MPSITEAMIPCATYIDTPSICHSGRTSTARKRLSVDIGQHSVRLTSPPGERLSASQRKFLLLCVAVCSSAGEMKMHFLFGANTL